MKNGIWILARFVLLEARRGGLFWLALACIVAAIGLAGFLSRVAVTESLQLETAVIGAFLRLCAAFLVAAFAITSTVREANDGGLELMLSLPISRTAYYLGKLAGFAACGVAVSACFALPMLYWASPAAVAPWFASLAAEAVLVAAASLFFATALASSVAAITATAGFYLLGRAIAAMQAIGSGPLAPEGVPQRIAQWSLDLIALLLPRLDAVTRTDWLMYGPPATGEFLAALAGLAIYIALLGAAGLFDFHRRNL